MKTLTEREVEELKSVIRKITFIKGAVQAMIEQGKTSEQALWDLRNGASEISNVLYNVHGDVYKGAVQS